jgi:hypothetical protein
MPATRTAAPDDVRFAIQRIAEAAARVPRGAQALVLALNAALDELQSAVDDARRLGAPEALISEALGTWSCSVDGDSATEADAEKPLMHMREQSAKDDQRTRRGRSAFHPSTRAAAIR